MAHSRDSRRGLRQHGLLLAGPLQQRQRQTKDGGMLLPPIAPSQLAESPLLLPQEGLSHAGSAGGRLRQLQLPIGCGCSKTAAQGVATASSGCCSCSSSLYLLQELYSAISTAAAAAGPDVQPRPFSYRLPLRGSPADRLLAIRITPPLAAVLLRWVGRQTGRQERA